MAVSVTIDCISKSIVSPLCSRLTEGERGRKKVTENGDPEARGRNCGAERERRDRDVYIYVGSKKERERTLKYGTSN